jgi:predicted RNA-binding protein with PIN domain
MKTLVKRKYLIIDAYNVMNDVSEFGRNMTHDLESAREDLIHNMIELSHYTKEKIVLVFDAYLVKNPIEKIETRNGIQIVFTKYTQTADSYIEHLVSQLSEDIRNELRVVTKDFAEQQIVMGKGAIRVLPRELYYEFVNMGSHIKRKYAHEDVGDTLENRLSKESIEALHKITEK